MKLCMYCKEKQVNLRTDAKYCSRKCWRKGYLPRARELRHNKCSRCRKAYRIKGTTRCRACGPVAKVVLCQGCKRKIERTSPGKKFCTPCKNRRKIYYARNRPPISEQKKFNVDCPRCSETINGSNLERHAKKCNINVGETRDWYNAREKTEEILERNEWTLGDKTIDQLDKEYMTWRCL